MVAQLFHYPRCNNTHHVGSGDAHLEVILAMSTLAFLALKAANPLIMCYSDYAFCVMNRLTGPKIGDSSLTLISIMGQQVSHYLFAYQNRQYTHFGRMYLCSC